MAIRILHISKMKGVSGSENHLLTLLAHLDKSRFEVELCILAESDHIPLLQNYASQLEAAGVHVVFQKMRRHIDERLIGNLCAYIKRKQIQIVHTHLIHADLYGTIAAKLAGVPVIISSQHNDDQFRHSLPMIWLNRLLARWQTKIIVISDWVGKFLQEVEGIPAEKITRIHYGLDPKPIEALADPAYIRQQFQIPDGAPVIGTIGRLTAQKGQIYLLDAARLLKSNFPNLRVVIVGDGELRHDLEAQAKTLDITDNVIFTGLRSYHEAMRLLSGMDVFVFPSLWEGFGLVLLEAMALKKPIVASNVSAIPESVLHEKTGVLVSSGDAKSLADAVRHVLQDPRLANAMGISGRQRLAQDFSVNGMVEKTVALYCALCESRCEMKFPSK